MFIDFNGKEQDVLSETGIKKLLKKNNILKYNGIAVAINNQVIPFKKWEEIALKNGDKVLVIQATQGG